MKHISLFGKNSVFSDIRYHTHCYTSLVMKTRSARKRVLLILFVVFFGGALVLLQQFDGDTVSNRRISGTMGNPGTPGDTNHFLSVVSDIGLTPPEGEDQVIVLRVAARNNKTEFRTDYISLYFSSDTQVDLNDCMVSSLEFHFDPDEALSGDVTIRPDDIACLSPGTWYVRAMTDDGFQGPTETVRFDNWVHLTLSPEDAESVSTTRIPMDRRDGRLLSLSVSNTTKHDSGEYPLDIYMAPVRTGGPVFLQLDCHVTTAKLRIPAGQTEVVRIELPREPMRIDCLDGSGSYDVGIYDQTTGQFVDVRGKVRITPYELGVMIAPDKTGLSSVVINDEVPITWKYKGFRSGSVDILISRGSGNDFTTLASGIPLEERSWTWIVREIPDQYTIRIQTAGGKRYVEIPTRVDLSASHRAVSDGTGEAVYDGNRLTERTDQDAPLDIESTFENYPNPFSDRTTIRFSIAKAGDVSVDVFDMTGRRVGSVFSGRLSMGVHEMEFTPDQLAGGTYLCRLVAPSGQRTHTLTLIR